MAPDFASLDPSRSLEAARAGIKASRFHADRIPEIFPGFGFRIRNFLAVETLLSSRHMFLDRVKILDVASEVAELSL